MNILEYNVTTTLSDQFVRNHVKFVWRTLCMSAEPHWDEFCPTEVIISSCCDTGAWEMNKGILAADSWDERLWALCRVRQRCTVCDINTKETCKKKKQQANSKFPSVKRKWTIKGLIKSKILFLFESFGVGNTNGSRQMCFVNNLILILQFSQLSFIGKQWIDSSCSYPGGTVV